jgi:hypothetical protein
MLQAKYKIIFIITITVVFSTADNLFAVPCYGTHMPQKNKFFAGVEYNFVIERDLKNHRGKVKNPDQFIMISYGIFDWLSLDLKGGSGGVDYKDSEYGDQEFSTSFAGAYGFRIRLWEDRDKDIKFVTGFQHISVHPKRVHTADGRYSIVVDEWQGSCLGSIRINQFVPYLGFKYETYDLIRWINNADSKRYKSQDNWGLVVGTDFWLKKNIKLNLECQFLDEKAASISLGFDF